MWRILNTWKVTVSIFKDWKIENHWKFKWSRGHTCQLHRPLNRVPRSLRAHAQPCCCGLVIASPCRSPATAVVGPLPPPRVPPRAPLSSRCRGPKEQPVFPPPPHSSHQLLSELWSPPAPLFFRPLRTARGILTVPQFSVPTCTAHLTIAYTICELNTEGFPFVFSSSCSPLPLPYPSSATV
jgi:hypothetical protein